MLYFYENFLPVEEIAQNPHQEHLYKSKKKRPMKVSKQGNTDFIIYPAVQS